eukprot:COSAG02_NODE_893_length_16140_cov_19.677621_15_plen_160_part_00
MSSIWPYISNQEALRVNQQWVGDPGRLLNATTSVAASDSLSAGNVASSNVEVWAKLQPGGAVALLAINTKEMGDADVIVELSQVAQQMSVATDSETTVSIPHGYQPVHHTWCTSQPCAIRDIWCVYVLLQSIDSTRVPLHTSHCHQRACWSACNWGLGE